MADQAALSEWAHAREFDLPLPSGVTRRVEPVSLQRMILAGRIPNPLRGVAQHLENGTLNLVEMPDSEREAWEDFKDLLCCLTVKDVEITPEFVRDEMPLEDRETLWAAAVHGRNAPNVATLVAMSSFRNESRRPSTPTRRPRAKARAK